ncbi:hypothetical protein GLE_2750 [Lysobacter enzymogenes]|uniref:Uncharacterized protein n=1 Tax=Lysobacter enzymogenes TaxID=69 RepID=A0A0S2DI41_LYSEN|nr:hypothetical protein GLE_2750 [Lysobacter enzymogenes]
MGPIPTQKQALGGVFQLRCNIRGGPCARAARDVRRGRGKSRFPIPIARPRPRSRPAPATPARGASRRPGKRAQVS